MAQNQEPVLLELAHLPREQVGPFLLLGLDKDASKDEIEARWAERVKWARKNQTNLTLEEINWARELINDPDRRVVADVKSLNADTVEDALARLARRFGAPEGRPGPGWDPLDEETPLADYQPPVEVPDAEAVRAAVVLPPVPQEVPAAARLLDDLVQAPLDPWEISL